MGKSASFAASLFSQLRGKFEIFEGRKKFRFATCTFADFKVAENVLKFCGHSSTTSFLKNRIF
jgi:hypothetical protein